RCCVWGWAVGCRVLVLRRGMYRMRPCWSVGIHKGSAHVTVALIHEKALAVGSIGGIWPSGPVFHGVFSGNHLPRAHDSIANFRFGLTEGRGGARQKSEQKQCGGFHVGHFPVSKFPMVRHKSVARFRAPTVPERTSRHKSRSFAQSTRHSCRAGGLTRPFQSLFDWSFLTEAAPTSP